MSLIEINHDPSRRQLIWFGISPALFCGILGAVLWHRFDWSNVAYTLWCVGGVLTFLFYAIPPIRLPFYIGWMYAFFPLGWLLTHVILACVYYLAFLPVGLILRLVRYDPLHRKFDRQAESYWIPKCDAPDVSRYFRQF